MNRIFRVFLLFLLSVSGVSCAPLLCHVCNSGWNNILFPDPEYHRQLVIVRQKRNTVFQAELTGWEYRNGRWLKVLGPWPAVIGRNGFSLLNQKKEGDGHTPSGIFTIGTAFGRAHTIRTGLEYFQSGEDDVWIDDPGSPDYNRHARLPVTAGSYEEMLRKDGLYDAGAVVEYNTSPVIPGAGSAIFIHIWRDGGKRPTAGCIALDRSRLHDLLRWLNRDLSPAISLGDNT